MKADISTQITPANPKPARQAYLKRRGKPTQAEKELVARLVVDQPAEMSSRQIVGLAKTLRRSKDVVKEMVEQAKENFVVSAGDYVTMHKAAVDAAYATGTPAGLKVAAEASQWAIEKISTDGVRIVDKATSDAPTGSRIMIGIALGGVNNPTTVIELPSVKADDGKI